MWGEKGKKGVKLRVILLQCIRKEIKYAEKCTFCPFALLSVDLERLRLYYLRNVMRKE